MVRHYTLEYWQDDGWYVGRLREIPGVFSQGETLEELEENIKDAYDLVMADEPTAPRADVKTKKFALIGVKRYALATLLTFSLLISCRVEQPSDLHSRSGEILADSQSREAAIRLAIAHLDTLNIEYDETEQVAGASEGHFEGKPAWVVTIGPRDFNYAEVVGTAIIEIDGEQVQVEKIQPHLPAIGPSVFVSQASGRVLAVRFNQ